MLSILRNRRFRLAVLSYTVSGAATAITPVALTLFLLDTHGGVEVLGLVLGARTVGFVAGAVLGGVVVDGYPRRTVLVLAGAVRGTAVLAAIPAFSGSVAMVCAAVLVAGVGEGIFRGAYQALVGEVVGEADRQRANALSTLSSRLLLVGGPTLATLLYLLIGGAATLLVTGLLWLGSAGVALRLPRGVRPPSDAARRRPFADYREVLREAGRHRWFLAGLASLVVWLSLGFAVQQLALPLISRDELGGNAFLGVALGCYSAGAVIAALVLARWTPRRPGTVAFVGLSLYGLVPLALTLPAVSPQLGAVLVLTAYFLGGIGIEAFNVPWFSAIQREVPPERMGRLFSFDFMVSHGVAPLGLILLPYALTEIGRTPVLLACGLLTIGAALAALAVPGARDLADPEPRRRSRPVPAAAPAPVLPPMLADHGHPAAQRNPSRNPAEDSSSPVQ
ncbi:MFS transporter [Actinoalloteichus fjordicus]|uniref:Arabinose efflux permease family protein n=1 Tax=Actinoalloteichus fjordicus TaxID=1612552 RepID=A0AAC9PTS6_9PSEU|nr:MFS transporter [Actinoalloteichus fjordicus]APU16463.1 arabinose efflux permease family protein [Actinoalloteichus fjordicus]